MNGVRDLVVVSAVGLIVASLIILGLSLQLRSAAAEIYRLRDIQLATHTTYFPDVKGLDCWVSTGGLWPGGELAPPGLFCDYRNK